MAILAARTLEQALEIAGASPSTGQDCAATSSSPGT
jgi:hypothetical protein